MRLRLLACACLALMATPAWAHHHHGFGGFYGPGGGWGGQRYFRPGPRFYGGWGGQRFYRHEDYGGWGGTYTYTYCAPWQGAPLYDDYGHVVACVQQW